MAQEGKKRVVRDDAPENTTLEGRIPAHDLETEAAVLCACMLDGLDAADTAMALCKAADFYSEAHRRIFEAIAELAAARAPIDIVQVSGWLRDRERLAQVGGMPYLGQILDASPALTTESLEAYAKRVMRKARLRRLAHKLRGHLARCYTTPDDELEDLFEDIEKDVTQECSNRSEGGFVQIGNVLHQVIDSLEEAERRASEGKVPGISTGFDRFDRITGGLHEGDLTVVAARPGMGKTSCVTGILKGVAERGYASAIFTAEMPTVQIGSRLLFSSARVDLQRGRTGTLHQNDWSKIQMTASELARLDVYLDDTAGPTLGTIRNRLRKLVGELGRRGKKLGAVVIDYLQICDLEEGKGETRDGAIGRITRGLKKLAKELEVPIILLSQLNRGPESREDKTPRISDLRESGSIENDADNIVFIYRDEYYLKAESLEPGVARLIIEKQRNGPTGTVTLGFEKESTAFYNLRDDEQDADARREDERQAAFPDV